MTWDYSMTPAAIIAGMNVNKNKNKNASTGVTIQPTMGPQQRTITSVRDAIKPTLSVGSSNIAGKSEQTSQTPASQSTFDWGSYGVADPRSGTDIGSINHNIDRLYEATVGRNADSAGRDYWRQQLQSGANTYDTIRDTLTGSDEYKDRLLMVQNNPNVTEAELDNLSSAYRSGLLDTAQVDGAYVAPDISIAGNYNAGGGGSGGSGGSMTGTGYDDTGLRSLISGLTGKLGDLRTAFDDYKKSSATDMQNMWNNYNWGYGQTVGGVRTQNELPGWAPKKGGTTGFFGRGGRSGKGLTTSSLNL